MFIGEQSKFIDERVKNILEVNYLLDAKLLIYIHNGAQHHLNIYFLFYI